MRHYPFLTKPLVSLPFAKIKICLLNAICYFLSQPAAAMYDGLVGRLEEQDLCAC
jgi:hypothetical protein